MSSENFTIGGYKVSPKTRTITINSEQVQLQPKVMGLLCYLSQNANKVISRDELIQHVWKGSVVSDDAIHRTISILRSVLKDNPKKPKYLETIPKTGYRIIAPVKYEKSLVENIKTQPVGFKTLSVLVLALIGVAAIVFLTLRKSDKPLIIPKFSYLTSHIGLEYAPQFSPVSNEILYSQYNKGWEGIFTIDSNIGSTAKRLNIDSKNIDSIWSPDGKAIYSHEATAETCKIVKHFLSGLPSQYISDCITKSRGMFFYMDVSKDETYLVVSERDSNSPRQLYQIDVDSGDRKPFFINTEGIGDYFPKYSPDNKWLAFARGFNANSRELMIVPAKGGEPIQLTNDDSAIQDLVWTSNNNIVFISNRQSGITGLWHAKLDGSSPAWLNTIIDGIDRFDISKDDKYLAYQNWYQPFNVFQMKLNALEDGMEKGIDLTQSKKENNFPSVSANGEHLVYVSNKTGEFDLWISDSDGKNPKLLVENVLKYSAPEWSPDSKQIAFTILNDGQGDACITNLQGQYFCVSKSKEDDLFPTWSKDNKAIYYTTMISAEPAEYISYRYDLSSRELIEPEFDSAINIQEGEEDNIVYYNQAVSSKIYKFNTETKLKELLIDDFYDVYYKSWHLAKSGIYYFGKNKEFRFYDFATKQINTLISSAKVGGYGTTSGLYVDDTEQNIYFSLSPMTLNGDIGLVENFAELLPQE
jgi:DNA-binding winged helix-turn-helix (wHTH) protein/Tol biopolymer transport system component